MVCSHKNHFTQFTTAWSRYSPKPFQVEIQNVLMEAPVDFWERKRSTAEEREMIDRYFLPWISEELAPIWASAIGRRGDVVEEILAGFEGYSMFRFLSLIFGHYRAWATLGGMDNPIIKVCERQFRWICWSAKAKRKSGGYAGVDIDIDPCVFFRRTGVVASCIGAVRPLQYLDTSEAPGLQIIADAISATQNSTVRLVRNIIINS